MFLCTHISNMSIRLKDGLLVLCATTTLACVGIVVGVVVAKVITTKSERRERELEREREEEQAMYNMHPSSSSRSPMSARSKARQTKELKNATLQMRQMLSSDEMEEFKNVCRGASMEVIAKQQAQMMPGNSGSERNAIVRTTSLDEVVTQNQAKIKQRKAKEPKQVLLDLQRGNGRFWMGLSERPEMSAMERRALIITQAPSVCIVGCADSRVPVEIVFDAGLGEIFVVRVAGNLLDTVSHGSIEYAVRHLDVKVVMVLGHEGCGAVKGATTMKDEDLAKEPPYLRELLGSIKSNVDIEQINLITDHRARDRQAVASNCTVQMRKLMDNPVVAEKVDAGSLLVVGAFYEITSGIVDFFSLDNNGIIKDI